MECFLMGLKRIFLWTLHVVLLAGFHSSLLLLLLLPVRISKLHIPVCKEAIKTSWGDVWVAIVVDVIAE